QCSFSAAELDATSANSAQSNAAFITLSLSCVQARHKDRTGCVTQHRLSYAAHKEPCHASLTMRTYNDQVCAPFFGDTQDLARGRAPAEELQRRGVPYSLRG